MLHPNQPGLLKWLQYQRKLDNGSQTLRKFAAEAVAIRRSQPSPKKDMLYALMHAQDPEMGKPLDEERIIDEIVTLIIATTICPSLFSFTIYDPLQNPQELSKARDEIDTVIGPDRPLTQAHFARLPHCDAILKESTRLSASAPGFNIESLPAETGPVMLAAANTKSLPTTTDRRPRIGEQPLYRLFRARCISPRDNAPQSVQQHAEGCTEIGNESALESYMLGSR